MNDQQAGKGMTELLPCPFCNGTAEVSQLVGLWSCECKDCYAATVPMPDGGAAVRRWNRRSPAPAAGEWQAISSAPKDGTMVDLWTNYGRVCNARWKHHHWMNGEPQGEKTWVPHDRDGPQPIPTHFMHLPAAPTTKDEGHD